MTCWGTQSFTAHDTINGLFVDELSKIATGVKNKFNLITKCRMKARNKGVFKA